MYTVIIFDPCYKKEFSFKTTCSRNAESFINAIKRHKNQIIDDLKLYIGAARVSVLDSDFNTLFTGKMSFNVFSGRGNIELKKA